MTSLFKKWKEQILYVPQSEVDDRAHLRRVLNDLILHVHPTRIPVSALRFTYTWGLGGMSAVLCLLLAATGILLTFRYEPTVDRAYASIQALESQVMFGSLCRAIHHWSANLLVVTTFLHLVRVFLTGGYKKGRARNWFIGLALFFLVLAFNFTGYLLPWDQLSYWAITVSTSIIKYIPLVGTAISDALLMGPEVGQGALSNFYGLHVAVLPTGLLILLGYHFWRIRKDGGISQPEHAETKPVQRVTTSPHLVQREVAVAAALVAFVMLWSMLVPAPLGEMANPLRSPNPAKAAWYFGSLQELLLHLDTLAALILLAIIAAGVIFLPYWDRRDENIGIYFRSPRGRWSALLGAGLSLILVPLMIFADEFWINWNILLPGSSSLLTNGLIPFGVLLLTLCAVYAAARWLLKTNHSEALVALFGFIVIGLIIMTLVCAFLRGPNMDLILPLPL